MIFKMQSMAFEGLFDGLEPASVGCVRSGGPGGRFSSRSLSPAPLVSPHCCFPRESSIIVICFTQVEFIHKILFEKKLLSLKSENH